MSEPNELLVLRLAMLGVIFLFVLAIAVLLRSGLANPRRVPAAMRRPVRGPRLVLVAAAQTGLSPGEVFEVAGEMTIGRDADNGIVLSDPSVSGQHASLERGRDGFRVVDLGSTNGTLVNGRPVDGRGMALTHGARVSLGAVVLRYET